MSVRMTEPLTHLRVDISFLDMICAPSSPDRSLPEGWSVESDVRLTIGDYRALYDAVGRPWCWWMRTVMSDAKLEGILSSPETRVFLLREGDDVRGFFELDVQTAWRRVNIAYFGLLPEAIGCGVGAAFLRHAIDAAWSFRPHRVTVNTCTADHPRALPIYLAAGFRLVQVVREEWDIPASLNMSLPVHLR